MQESQIGQLIEVVDLFFTDLRIMFKIYMFSNIFRVMRETALYMILKV